MYISENEIREVLTYKALIPAIRQVLIDYSAGRAIQPPRTIMRTGISEDRRRDGWFAVMPVVHGDAMAVKTVTFYRRNAEVGMPTHMATVELLDRATGQPLALMDGRLITEMRTAATTAAGFEAIARLHFAIPPRSLGILGSGVQARAHIEALRVVWPEMSEIRIWSPTVSHAERLADAAGGRSVSIEDAATADVVLTVTAAVEPVLEGRWLAPDALVLAAGATGDGARELDDEVMQTSYLVAESRDCVGRESGDVRGSGATIEAEIGEVLARPESAAIPKSGRVLYKTVGMAIEDLAAARLVWQTRQAKP